MSVQIVVVRKARQDDLSGIAKVRVDTWRDAYAGFIPDDFLAGLSYEATADGWLMLFFENRAPGVEVFVAETEGKEIVGVAVCGPEREQDPVYQGEVYVLYVLPEYQNQGIGRRLVAACVQHLIKQLSAKTMLIWAFAENPYRRFYEMLGGRAVREKSKEIGGKTYLEAGYGWEDIHALAG